MNEPAREFSGACDCAASGCERNCRDGGDGLLRRISPKGPGKPFVGLCQEHYGRSVVLKPEAARLLEGGS